MHFCSLEAPQRTPHRRATARPDGSGYCGQFHRGRKEGTGVYIWPDGAEYRGTWKDNKIHGYAARACSMLRVVFPSVLSVLSSANGISR